MKTKKMRKLIICSIPELRPGDKVAVALENNPPSLIMTVSKVTETHIHVEPEVPGWAGYKHGRFDKVSGTKAIKFNNGIDSGVSSTHRIVGKVVAA